MSILLEELFHVIGEVYAPGRFWFKEGMTLREAITLAQGLTLNAKSQDAVIVRLDWATNVKQTIKVNIQDVMSGKERDVPVMPDDLIIIPAIQSVKPNREMIPRNPVPPCLNGEPCIALSDPHRVRTS